MSWKPFSEWLRKKLIRQVRETFFEKQEEGEFAIFISRSHKQKKRKNFLKSARRPECIVPLRGERVNGRRVEHKKKIKKKIREKENRFKLKKNNNYSKVFSWNNRWLNWRLRNEDLPRSVLSQRPPTSRKTLGFARIFLISFVPHISRNDRRQQANII